MNTKDFTQIEIKADGEPGTFTALASVFGNVDAVGDRMMPGAFTRTLKERQAKGDPLPIFFSHQHDDPESLIGKVEPDDAYETEEGLVVEGKLSIDSNPRAKLVWEHMKDGLIKAWSFGYKVPDGGEKRANGANEVSDVDLLEAGPTFVGANALAMTQAVKSAASLEDAEAIVAAMSDEEKARLLEALKADSEPAEKTDPPPEAVEEENAKPRDPVKEQVGHELVDLALGR